MLATEYVYNMKFSHSVLIAVSCFTFSYCSTRQNEKSEASKDTISGETIDKMMEDAKSAEPTILLWYPENSDIDSTTKDSAIIVPPKDYMYVAETKGGEVVYGVDRITVTCSCLAGNGCSPIANGGTYGCVTSSCHSCLMSIKGMDKHEDDEEYKTGGFMKKDLVVSIAPKASALPVAFSAMFDVPGLNDNLDKLYLKYYAALKDIPKFIDTDSGYAAPTGYEAVVINVAGRAAMGIFPKGSVDPKTANVSNAYSCSCIGKGSGCTAKTTPNGSGFCLAGNCSAYEMSIRNSGEEMSYESFEF